MRASFGRAGNRGLQRRVDWGGSKGGGYGEGWGCGDVDEHLVRAIASNLILDHRIGITAGNWELLQQGCCSRGM